MEIGQVKQKIVAETMALMSLKVDNEEVVKQTFKSILNQVEILLKTVSPQSELYAKALDLMQTGMTNEYKQFEESTSYEQKEQALIQLRHKAAEVSTLLQSL